MADKYIFSSRCRKGGKMKQIKLEPHLTRRSTHYSKDDPAVPAELFTVKNDSPDFAGINYPLPNAKDDYTAMLKTGGVTWLASYKGITRYDPDAAFSFDRVMYFTKDRDLTDSGIKAMLPAENGIWALTGDGVTLIELIMMTPEEICRAHLDETLKYVDRHGMVSQRWLREPRNLDSIYPYGDSDNDGGFTSKFSIGEIFRYACFKRDYGENDPRTVEAKEAAIRATEACLLLMYVHGRGNGFVARTYILSDAPTPDDGLFFRRQGNQAYCLETTEAKNRGIVGLRIDCSSPIPERLRHLFTDDGYTEDDIIYKADTSSDEITLQFLNLLAAHRHLTEDDPELDAIIKDAVSRVVSHIIDNGFILTDYSGLSTTWAKWNEEYFNTEDGYVDAALNSAEMLFFLKVAMEITGEEGKWLETYNYLVNERGYADLTTKHAERLQQFCIATDTEFNENIMYGDHMLASAALTGLCLLEKDEALLKKYRYGYKAWRSTIAGEHNPGYDFMYILSCPDETIEEDRVKEWFARHNISRLAAGVGLVGRHDIPIAATKHGYKQCSSLVPPDERFISKYDRDSLEYKNEDSGGIYCIESAYVYNYAYWIGKYFGIIY